MEETSESQVSDQQAVSQQAAEALSESLPWFWSTLSLRAVRWDVAAMCLQITSHDTQMSAGHETPRADVEEGSPLIDTLVADIHSTHTFKKKAPIKLPYLQSIPPPNHLSVLPSFSQGLHKGL